MDTGEMGSATEDTLNRFARERDELMVFRAINLYNLARAEWGMSEREAVEYAVEKLTEREGAE